MGKFAHTRTSGPKKPGLCAINFCDNGIAIAHVIREAKQKPALKFCSFIPFENIQMADQQKIITVLKQVFKEQQLQGVACSWILQPDSYRLLSMESLPVAEDELLAALRWRVKDLIDFPITETSIDYFSIPNQHEHEKEKYLYVIATKTKYLQDQTQTIKDSGFDLNIIDITELALRNIVQLLPEDKGGIGLIEFNSSGVKLILTKEGCIYLVRQIDLRTKSPLVINLTDSEQEAWLTKIKLSKLVEEIQRSFDYYETQLDQPPITKLVVTPASHPLLAELQAQFPTEIIGLDLNQLLTYEGNGGELKEAVSSPCLVAIGGALRSSEVGNAPTN
jgi:MSHA biogenesis protein MshI